MIIGTESNILKKLEEQEKEEGSLPLLLRFYREILAVQSDAKEHICIPTAPPSNDVIEHRLARKLPLLSWGNLAIDWTQLRDTFIKVSAIFARYAELFGEKPEILKKSRSGRLLTKKVAAAWFNGKELPATALTRGVESSILQSIIHATLKPCLANYAQTFIGLIDQERWRQRYCPICGGAPDFGYLDTENGSRWFMCSRCDTEWLSQRIECPYCGNKDQKTIAYFTDDEGLYRLYVCEKCKRYLKTIDLRKTEHDVLLPLERFYTLAMDRQAQQQGYSSYR